VAHGVNTAVKEDETAGRHEVIDRVSAQTRPQQLPPRDDPVLRARDPRREGKWSDFTGYRPVNSLHPTILPPPASPNNAQM
jgi:hypothetical protein